MPPAGRLRANREHIVNDANGFGKVLRTKGLLETFGGLSPEDSLVRMPKGFEADAPHAEQLKLKSYVAWRETGATRLSSDALTDLLLTDFRAGAPLVKWLRGAGPTP
jgi:uncharacterized protein (DUF2461 family)